MIGTFLHSRFLHPKFDPNTQAGTPVPLPSHPYRTVGCVFNHKTFYANAQLSDSVPVCRFDLHNGSLWKSMSPEAIASVTCATALVSPTKEEISWGAGLPCTSLCSSSQPCWGVFPPLLPSRVDPVLSSSEMEVELKSLTAQHRAVSMVTL